MNRSVPRDPAATDPDLIRQEIARTRQELGITVEELVARADVKARARERVAGARRRAAEFAGPAGRIGLALVLGVGVVILVRYLRDGRWPASRRR